MAIHGIGGHREESWTVNGVNWLRDLLPSEIPHTRIFSWGYNDNDSEIQPHHLLGHAPTLLSDLQRERKFTEVLPVLHILRVIIFADEYSRPRNALSYLLLTTWEG